MHYLFSLILNEKHVINVYSSIVLLLFWCDAYLMKIFDQLHNFAFFKLCFKAWF